MKTLPFVFFVASLLFCFSPTSRATLTITTSITLDFISSEPALVSDPYGFDGSVWNITFTKDAVTYQSYEGVGYLSTPTVTLGISGTEGGAYDGTYEVSIAVAAMTGEFWALPKYGDAMSFLTDGTSTSIFALGTTGYTVRLYTTGDTVVQSEEVFIPGGTVISASDFDGALLNYTILIETSGEGYAEYGALGSLNAVLIPEPAHCTLLAGLALLVLARRWRL